MEEIRYMKRQALHITFHNPNTKAESEVLAREFISYAANGVLAKMILDKDEKRTLTIVSKSEGDLD